MDTTQRCGGCRHWGPFEGDEAKANPGWGECLRILHYDTAREDEPERFENDIAFAVDGSGYKAAVRCKDDFGCVLFEAKGER